MKVKARRKANIKLKVRVNDNNTGMQKYTEKREN